MCVCVVYTNYNIYSSTWSLQKNIICAFLMQKKDKTQQNMKIEQSALHNQSNSQYYLYGAFHNKLCFKTPLQKCMMSMLIINTYYRSQCLLLLWFMQSLLAQSHTVKNDFQSSKKKQRLLQMQSCKENIISVFLSQFHV